MYKDFLNSKSKLSRVNMEQSNIFLWLKIE